MFARLHRVFPDVHVAIEVVDVFSQVQQLGRFRPVELASGLVVSAGCLGKQIAQVHRWSKRLVQTLGKEKVIETIEDLRELTRVLDADDPVEGDGSTNADRR